MSIGQATDYIWKTAYWHCRDKSRADDLTQDVFEKLLRRVGDGTLAISGNPGAFLLTVTKNTFLDGLRRKDTVIRGNEYKVVALADEHNTGTAEGDPEALIIRAETIDHLREAIASLKKEQQDVVILATYQGMSRRDIARTLGEAPSTIQSRQIAAYSAIRGFLTRRGSGRNT